MVGTQDQVLGFDVQLVSTVLSAVTILYCPIGKDCASVSLSGAGAVDAPSPLSLFLFLLPTVNPTPSPTASPITTSATRPTMRHIRPQPPLLRCFRWNPPDCRRAASFSPSTGPLLALSSSPITGLGTQSYPVPVRVVDSLGRTFRGQIDDVADCGGICCIDALSRSWLFGGIGGVSGATGWSAS